MCVQWCCKNCTGRLTQLTHRWARERCNDYFIARSKNQSLTDCPNGPAWELRRAFHRHPYRGPQRCDDCIKAGRQGFKIVDLARQKAIVALGERPQYTGVIYLGELEVPDDFDEITQHLVGLPSRVDAMKSNWESFSSANEHLPSHEFERTWATRFAGLNAGVGPEAMRPASILGLQGMSGEEPKRNMVLAEEASCSPHQQNHKIPSTFEGNEMSPSARYQIEYESNSSIHKSNSTTVGQEGSRSPCQDIQYDISPNETKRNIKPSEKATSKTRHLQLCHRISPDTEKEGIKTLEEDEAPRVRHRQVHHDTTSALCSSTSQSIRARPWDL